MADWRAVVTPHEVTDPCPFCHGVGRKVSQCLSCSGKGEWEVYYGHVHGLKTCWDCHGSRVWVYECTACHGTGQRSAVNPNLVCAEKFVVDYFRRVPSPKEPILHKVAVATVGVILSILILLVVPQCQDSISRLLGGAK